MDRHHLRSVIALSAAMALLGGLVAGVLSSRSAQAARNSSGTYTLPSGNPVQSGTTITTTWANATLPDIGTELTNSLDRNGRGAMAAALQLANGTSAAPGLTFGTETNSGLYRASSNTFDFQVAGNTIQQWGLSGATFSSPGSGVAATLTVTPGAGNSGGITATGAGTSAGGTFTGGASAGSGLVATGGATSGTGIVATGGSTDGQGVNGVGTGAGAGVTGIGGTTGNGVRGVSGASNGGFGVSASGHAGTTNPGGTFANGTAATAATQQDAVTLTNGNLSLSGTVNPNIGVGFSNRLTPKNVPKAWVSFNSGASPAINDGFNIASVTTGTTTATITFATALANTGYSVSCMANQTYVVSVSTLSAGSFSITGFSTNLATSWTPNTQTISVYCVVFGAQ